MNNEITISLETHNMLQDLGKLKKELDKRLKKELIPQIKTCITNNDIPTLLHMAEMTKEHSFNIRCYQAIVEIKNKNNG